MVKTESGFRIGLAGWSEAVSRRSASFPAPVRDGEKVPALGRYASVFDFVEINASFYRQFRAETYARWAAETPNDFRFAVKLPRLITHFTRLKNPDLIGPFLGTVSGLGEKLAALLVQLPPSLAFDSAVAAVFLDALRASYGGALVCEPRHPSWLANEARDLLASHRIGLVSTVVPEAMKEAGDADVPLYVRLHGTPRRYYSAYTGEQLAQLAEFLRLNPRRQRFVVFDNTASGAAVKNAMELRERLAVACGGGHV
jgi:uncharacterized protein YecE (DUF72 family)